MRLKFNTIEDAESFRLFFVNKTELNAYVVLDTLEGGYYINTDKCGYLNTENSALVEMWRKKRGLPEDYKEEAGIKNDDGKVLAGCLADLSHGLVEVSKVATFGHDKYKSRNGWKSVKNAEIMYIDALWRHLLDLANVNAVDKESECLVLAHIAWNALALITLLKDKDGE